MTQRRRQQLLLAVLALLALFVGWRQLLGVWDRGGRPAARRERSSGSLDRRGLGGAAAIDLVELDVEALQNKPNTYRPGRDPFRFGGPERPPVRAAPAPPPPPVEARPAAVESEPGRPQPPPVDVVYLGNFGPHRRRIAVFSDGESIYNAMVGDILKEKFVVVSIGYESVELEFVGFPDVAPARLGVGG